MVHTQIAFCAEEKVCKAKKLSKQNPKVACTTKDHGEEACDVSGKLVKNCRSCAHKVATVRWRWDGEERNHGYTEPRKYGTTESQILCPLAFIRKRQRTKMTYPEGTHSCFHVDSVLCVQGEWHLKCITSLSSLYM